jgi:hypothetical protein
MVSIYMCELFSLTVARATPLFSTAWRRPKKFFGSVVLLFMDMVEGGSWIVESCESLWRGLGLQIFVSCLERRIVVTVCCRVGFVRSLGVVSRCLLARQLLNTFWIYSDVFF